MEYYSPSLSRSDYTDELKQQSHAMLTQCWTVLSEALDKYVEIDAHNLPHVKFSEEIQYPLYDSSQHTCVLPIFLHLSKTAYIHELVHYVAAQRKGTPGTGFFIPEKQQGNAWNEGVTQMLTKMILRGDSYTQNEEYKKECISTKEHFHKKIVHTLITTVEEERLFYAQEKKELHEAKRMKKQEEKRQLLERLRAIRMPTQTVASSERADPQLVEEIYQEGESNALEKFAMKSDLLEEGMYDIDGYRTIQKIIHVVVEYLGCFYATSCQEEKERMYHAYFRGDQSWWDRVRVALGEDLTVQFQYMAIDDYARHEQLLRMCLSLPLLKNIRASRHEMRA